MWPGNGHRSEGDSRWARRPRGRNSVSTASQCPGQAAAAAYHQAPARRQCGGLGSLTQRPCGLGPGPLCISSGFFVASPSLPSTAAVSGCRGLSRSRKEKLVELEERGRWRPGGGFDHSLDRALDRGGVGVGRTVVYKGHCTTIPLLCVACFSRHMYPQRISTCISQARTQPAAPQTRDGGTVVFLERGCHRWTCVHGTAPCHGCREASSFLLRLLSLLVSLLKSVPSTK